MTLSQLHLNYERILKLRGEARELLEQYPEKRVQAFTGSLETLLEELSVFQIELEMQNEELRDLQQRLEQAQSDYRAFFHNAPTAIITLTERGYLDQANHAAIELLEIEELSSLPLDKISITPMLQPTELQAFMAHLRNAASGEIRRERFQLRRKKGDPLPALFQSRLLEEAEEKAEARLLCILTPLN
ncbi:MAG: PAS domain S-box protein [Verrucomicrobia bacterium]|jgi:PAS domain S-box-containing protein|nr:PAS domain S-box protein [Verrucomicrobiota bacterium]